MNSNSGFPPKSLFREKELWILVVLIILFFHRPLFFGETFYFRDLYNHFYPQKRLLVELISRGELPLWDPYRHGGQPFLGNMNNAASYPSNILYFLFPTVTAFNFDIVLHVILAAVGSYILARKLLLSAAASMVTSIAFAFAGPALSIPNVWLYAPCHLPLMLYFWHRFLTEQRWPLFVLASLTGVLQLLAGRPEMTAFSLLLLAGWTLFFPYSQQKISKRFLLLAALSAVIAAGSAIQLIPMAEIVFNSSRAAGTDFRTFAAWSVHPKRLPEVFFPQFFGEIFGLSISDYWGLRFEDLGMPYIISIYFGISILFLSIAGGLSKVTHEGLPVRVRIFLIFISLLAITFSIGRFLPFFYELYEFVPGIRIFRYPVKFMIIALLPLALLAGFQADSLFTNGGKSTGKLLPALALILSAALLLFCFLFAATGGKVELQSYFQTPVNIFVKRGLTRSFFHAAIIWTALSILIWKFRKGSPLYSRYLFVAVIAADLVSAGAAVNHFAPRDFLSAPALAEVVKKEIGDGKLYRSGDRGSLNYIVPQNHSMFVDRWRIEMLSNYLAASCAIPVVFHEDYDRMEWHRLENLSETVRHSSWDKRLPVFSAAGVKVIIADEVIERPGLKLLSIIENKSDQPYYLHKMTRCSSRAYFVQSAKFVKDDQAVLEAMTDPNFDPCKTVLLQKPNGALPPPGQSSILTRSLNSGSQEYRVTNDSAGYMVFSETNYPGWEITVDGKIAEIVQANYAYSAIFLESGTHEIQRKYNPASIKYGALVSLFTLGLLGFVAGIKKSAPSRKNRLI